MKINFSQFKNFIENIEKDGITDNAVFNITTDNKAVNYYFYLWKEKKKRFENRHIPFYKYCKWKNNALSIIEKSIKKNKLIDIRRYQKNEHRHYRR